MKKLVSTAAFFMCVFSSAPSFSSPLNQKSTLMQDFIASEDLMQDSYYSRDNEESPYPVIWKKLLADKNVSVEKVLDERGVNLEQPCSYQAAIKRFKDIQKNYSDTKYPQIWLDNQTILFTACQQQSDQSQKPAEPDMNNLPPEAKSDFLYQLASWHFATHSYEKALELYNQVFSIQDAPMRDISGFMIVRCIYRMGNKSDSYYKAEAFYKDSSLKKYNQNW